MIDNADLPYCFTATAVREALATTSVPNLELAMVATVEGQRVEWWADPDCNHFVAIVLDGRGNACFYDGGKLDPDKGCLFEKRD